MTGTFLISVVAKINFTCSGGSSSVLRSALNAFLDSEPESQEEFFTYMYDTYPVFPSVLEEMSADVLDHILAVTYPTDDTDRTPQDLEQALTDAEEGNDQHHDPDY